MFLAILFLPNLLALLFSMWLMSWLVRLSIPYSAENAGWGQVGVIVWSVWSVPVELLLFGGTILSSAGAKSLKHRPRPIGLYVITAALVINVGLLTIALILRSR